MPNLPLKEAIDLGVAHQQAGRLAHAEAVYREILAQQPDQPDALHLLGLIFGGRGQLNEALQLIQRAIALAPATTLYYQNLGRLYGQTGQTALAVEWFSRALTTAPNSAESWHELGCAQLAHQDLPRAQASLGQCLRLDPRHAHAWVSLGLIHRQQGRLAEALQCFGQAVAIEPNSVEGHGNLGNTLELLGRYEEALAHYRHVLPLAPDHYMLHYNIGVSLGELGRYEEAAASYQRTIALQPDHAPAYNNLGNALKFMGRFEEAIAAYRRTIALRPDLPEVHTNLAAIHASRAEHDQALACNQRALSLRPDHPQIHSNVCYSLLFSPAHGTAAQAAELAAWNQRHGVPRRPLRRPHNNRPDPDRRLRIGYVSPDLRDHVVARNLEPAFRLRDRAAFEVYCYFNHAVKDDMTRHLMTMSDHWRDIWTVKDQEIAERIRADGIDILVDLALHMSGSQLVVFAHKPAPVHVTFAGYPGSTGLETMDYRITDAQLAPPEMEGAFVEKTVRIGSFWCYDPLGVTHTPGALPAAGRGHVTFGCLNHFCKINDDVLRLWAQVMAAVPGSRLVLLTEEGTHRDRTRAFFAQLGIHGERILFAGKKPRPEYLALYHQIDLGLDTVPYNGHTTSLDSLWMGVPVVTLVGPTEVGRAGLSQLTNLGMPELVTRTPADFVRVAVELARDLPRLAAYRASLRGRMEQSILMDNAGFTRSLEAAYREMWRKWCAAGQR